MTLKRFLDRIGVSEGHHTMLTERHGVLSIAKLVFLVVGDCLDLPVELAKLQRRLVAAVTYLTQVRARAHQRSFDDAAERVVLLKPNESGSWEDFVLRNYHVVEQPGRGIAIPRNVQNKKPSPVTIHQCAARESQDDSRLDKVREVENIVKETNWTLNNEVTLKTCRRIERGIPLLSFLALKPHQRDGVEFILTKYNNKPDDGMLLADAAGLGKTWQALYAIFTLMHCGLVKNVLTISPPSVVRKVWLKEVKKVAQFFPDLDGKLAIVEYSSDFSREERDRALRETKSKGMWLLTIASNCLIHDNNNGLFSSAGKCQSWWSMIVVDEAHQAKNPSTNIRKALQSTRLTRKAFRLMLTATPHMNNLEEFRSLLGWVTCGRNKSFNNKKAFLEQYAKPMDPLVRRGASTSDIHRANRVREKFQRMVEPFVLQRSKGCLQLVEKREYVLFLPPSDAQWNALEAINKARLEMGGKSRHLVDIMKHRLICCHPGLVKGLDREEFEAMLSGDPECSDDVFASFDEMYRDDPKVHKSIVNESPRIPFVTAILKMLVSCSDDRTIVFSFFRVQLSQMEHALRQEGIGCYRVDGSTDRRTREMIFNDFNSTASEHKVMLLPIGVGGVGLNLTGANRVIMLEPSWNPATVEQAVSRTHRIDQEKDVEVFHVCMSGTIEDMMFADVLVPKEGMIRASSTRTGTQLERYGDDPAARALLQLGVRNKCYTLERHPKSSDYPKHWDFIQKLPGAKGCLRYDTIYKKFEGAFESGAGVVVGSKRSRDTDTPVGVDGNRNTTKMLRRPSSFDNESETSATEVLSDSSAVSRGPHKTRDSV